MSISGCSEKLNMFFQEFSQQTSGKQHELSANITRVYVQQCRQWQMLEKWFNIPLFSTRREMPTGITPIHKNTNIEGKNSILPSTLSEIFGKQYN